MDPVSPEAVERTDAAFESVRAPRPAPVTSRCGRSTRRWRATAAPFRAYRLTAVMTPCSHESAAATPASLLPRRSAPRTPAQIFPGRSPPSLYIELMTRLEF